jgi:protein ImuA
MDAVQNLEELHPTLWRASQLGRAETRCVDTGFPPLSNQLVGRGWPTGTLIELMVQQPGIGELRLLGPALAQVASRKIVMIQPPHTPHVPAMTALGVGPSDLIWVKPKSTNDMLWATEQVLRSGSCGAALLWTTQIRQEHLRRLHLAAQAGETLLYVFRPLAAAQDASPSPLRLSLRPAPGGLDITFVKRRGPVRDEALFLPLPGPLTRPAFPVQTPTPTTAPVPPVLATHQ